MIKKKDLVIMSCLRENCRSTLTQLSKKTNIPISTIYDRIKLHENNFIKKHTCIIDFAKLGFGARANIVIKVEKDDREKIKVDLAKHRNINTLYKISNGYDYMIEGIFKNIKELEDFVEKLDQKYNIKEKHTYYIIDDLKREDFMSNLALLNLVMPDI